MDKKEGEKVGKKAGSFVGKKVNELVDKKVDKIEEKTGFDFDKNEDVSYSTIRDSIQRLYT